MEAADASEGKKSGKPKASADTPATEARKLGKAKQASAETAAAETLTPFAVDCNEFLAFLQAVPMKSPQVIAAPLSLCTDKKARVWFPKMDRRAPAKAAHAGPTRSHRPS